MKYHQEGTTHENEEWESENNCLRRMLTWPEFVASCYATLKYVVSRDIRQHICPFIQAQASKFHIIHAARKSRRNKWFNIPKILAVLLTHRLPAPATDPPRASEHQSTRTAGHQQEPREKAHRQTSAWPRNIYTMLLKTQCLWHMCLRHTTYNITVP